MDTYRASFSLEKYCRYFLFHNDRDFIDCCHFFQKLYKEGVKSTDDETILKCLQYALDYINTSLEAILNCYCDKIKKEDETFFKTVKWEREIYSLKQVYKDITIPQNSNFCAMQ